MAETVNINDFKKEQAKRERKQKAINFINDKAKWINDHKAEIVGTATLVLGAGKVAAKATRKISNAKEQYDMKHRYYDPQMHKCWKIKKPMTNQDLTAIAEGRANGLSYEQILRDLKKI